MVDKEQVCELSQKVIDNAIIGNYGVAITTQQDILWLYPQNDPEVIPHLCRLGNLLYLEEKYNIAFDCYMCCVRLSVINNPSIIDDFRAMRRGDQAARDRLTRHFDEFAYHAGHAIFDPRYKFDVNYSNFWDTIEAYKKSLKVAGRLTVTFNYKDKEYDDAVTDRVLTRAILGKFFDDELLNMSPDFEKRAYFRLEALVRTNLLG